MSSARPALRRLLVVGALGAVAVSGALLAGAATATAATATRYVATTGNDGGDTPSTCTVKTKPCKTIQHAVDEAAAGDTVSVSAGKYAESVFVTKSLTIAGPTSGKATISAPPSDDSDASLVAVSTDGSAMSVHLQRLDISGNADGPGVVDGGVDLTVTDSSISRNSLFGVLAEFGTVTVADSTIAGNAGVGVDNLGSIVGITGSSVSGTTPGSEDGTEELPYIPGSGVDTFAGTTNLSGTTVSGNATQGVYSVDIQEMDEDAAQVAAAPTLTAPVVNVKRSTVSGNGLIGLAIGPGSTASIATSTVSGNGGSNVYTESSNTTITASTLTGVKPSSIDQDGFGADQAGIVALPPTPQEQPTVTRRSTSTPVFARPTQSVSSRIIGSGRTVQAKVAAAPVSIDGPTVISLAGSIVSGNGPLADCAAPTTITPVDGRSAAVTSDADSPIVDNGYNLSQDEKNTCGFSTANHDLVKTAPKVGALADNGGATETQLPATGSPVLDVIPSGKAGCVTGSTDQRGVSRPQGGKCDIGAVEVKVDPLAITTQSLPHGTVGVAYHKTLAATGGADTKYVWSLAPGTTLPGGLTLSPSGVLSGTPTDSGTFSVTVSVNDPVTKKFSLVIAAAAAAPNGGGNAPIANTGTPVGSLSATGIAAVVAGGLMLMAGAGVIGKRRGRHRAAR